MPDEKDRFGDKLRDVERAREDQYFAKRDRELLENIRRKREAEADAEQRTGAYMRCPKCGEQLQVRVLREITFEECPGCGGLWLDKGEFEQLARREGEDWLGRLFRSREE